MQLSPSDVMDPIWKDYADCGRDDQCVSWRKIWIPLTNYGKNDEESGSTLISFFLQRRFGLTPNCSIVNVQCCAGISSNESKFLLKASGNKQNRVWHNGRGYTQNVILCQNNQLKALALSCSISHCPWMGISIKVEAHCGIMTTITVPFHFNKQTKVTTDFPKDKRQWIS